MEIKHDYVCSNKGGTIFSILLQANGMNCGSINAKVAFPLVECKDHDDTFQLFEFMEPFSLSVHQVRRSLWNLVPSAFSLP